MDLAENLLNYWTLKYINLSYNKINKLGTNALLYLIYFDISNQKKLIFIYINSYNNIKNL